MVETYGGFFENFEKRQHHGKETLRRLTSSPPQAARIPTAT
jgi:hypothetical protein